MGKGRDNNNKMTGCLKLDIRNILQIVMFVIIFFSLNASYAQPPVQSSECPLFDAGKLMDKINSEEQDIVILDIRLLEDYRKGHIPDAVSIPAKREVLKARERIISEIDINDRVIIVDDEVMLPRGRPVDTSAWFICERMKDFGYKYVYILKGGMEGWNGPIKVGQ